MYTLIFLLLIPLIAVIDSNVDPGLYFNLAFWQAANQHPNVTGSLSLAATNVSVLEPYSSQDEKGIWGIVRWRGFGVTYVF